MVRSSVLGGVGLATAVVFACGLALLVYPKMARPSALLNTATVANRLQGRASALRQSAAAMEAAALKRETEASEDVAALKYLRQAQDELNAYAANLEGLVTVTNDGKFTALSPQFPKEAAELHALIDHSLSRMDGISVKLAQNAELSRPVLAVRPAVSHPARIQLHHASGGHTTVLAKHTTVPAAHKKHSIHKIHKAASKAAPISKKSSIHTAALHAQQAPLTQEQAVLAKLRRVKEFERAAAHMQPAMVAATLAHRALATAGHTQMLVQPGPLHGALPVRNGALVRQGTLFNPHELGLDEDEEQSQAEEQAEPSDVPVGTPSSWSDDASDYPHTTWRAILAATKSTNASSAPAVEAAAAGNESNASTAAAPPKWDPADDPRLACNKTCQDTILHSVVGISYKVVKRCVPTCATGNYILKTYGAPLKSWTTVSELQDQDKTCTPAPEYMKCKLDLMKPVCLKFEEVMPEYCLSNPMESVCSTCQQLETFMTAQNNAANGGPKPNPKTANCVLGFLC